MFGKKKEVKRRKKGKVTKKTSVKGRKKTRKKVGRVAIRKRASVTSVKKLALSGAIRDLENEIRTLGKRKSQLKRSLTGVSSTIDVDREQERTLQHRIARLIEKEARLNKRRKTLQTKIDRVSDKMSKISKIRSEMADI